MFGFWRRFIVRDVRVSFDPVQLKAILDTVSGFSESAELKKLAEQGKRIAAHAKAVADQLEAITR